MTATSTSEKHTADEIVILLAAAQIAERDYHEWKRSRGKRVDQKNCGPLALELRQKAELRQQNLVAARKATGAAA